MSTSLSSGTGLHSPYEGSLLPLLEALGICNCIHERLLALLAVLWMPGHPLAQLCNVFVEKRLQYPSA